MVQKQFKIVITLLLEMFGHNSFKNVIRIIFPPHNSNIFLPILGQRQLIMLCDVSGSFTFYFQNYCMECICH